MAIAWVPTLSVMVTAPVLVPTAVGVKVICREQLPPAASVVGRVAQFELLTAKSPLAVKLLTVMLLVPLLVNVAVCELLVVPTVWLPKVNVDVESCAPGALPVPVRDTD